MSSEYIALASDRILVTGSNGFIGTRVVEILLEYRYRNIRGFVRPSSRLDRLEKVLSQFDAGRDVALVTGDFLSPTDCRNAAQGVSVIYHLAACMEQPLTGTCMTSALDTRSSMDA